MYKTLKISNVHIFQHPSLPLLLYTHTCILKSKVHFHSSLQHLAKSSPTWICLHIACISYTDSFIINKVTIRVTLGNIKNVYIVSKEAVVLFIVVEDE